MVWWSSQFRRKAFDLPGWIQNTFVILPAQQHMELLGCGLGDESVSVFDVSNRCDCQVCLSQGILIEGLRCGIPECVYLSVLGVQEQIREFLLVCGGSEGLEIRRDRGIYNLVLGCLVALWEITSFGETEEGMRVVVVVEHLAKIGGAIWDRNGGQSRIGIHELGEIDIVEVSSILYGHEVRVLGWETQELGNVLDGGGVVFEFDWD